jgi:conserved oligomeric Golgi complex subunit 4
MLSAVRSSSERHTAYSALCVAVGSPLISCITTVIVGMCREGRPLDACKIIGDMEESRCTPNAVTYATLVSGLCVSGLYDKAQTYLEDMVVKGFVPHFSVYHSVIKGYCSVGKVENAAQTMSQMLDLGVIPHVESWNSVIRSMCNDEDNIEALLLPLVTGSRQILNTISIRTLN